MIDWAYVLVIILGVMLALFLLAGVVLLVMMIRISVQIKSVADSARRTADTIEETVKRTRNMKVLGGLIKGILRARGTSRKK